MDSKKDPLKSRRIRSSFISARFIRRRWRISQYAMREGKGFSVITGEAGTGKTTLVHMLLSKLEGNVRTSYIFNPIMDRADFLNYICDDLGIESKGMKSRGQSLTALHNFLLDCFARDEKVFLIIDEAQSLEPALLQEVRLLTNLETSKSKLLHVILLGQPELDRILKEAALSPFEAKDHRPLSVAAAQA